MDLFEKLIADYGPLGKYSSTVHGYYTFPKLEGPFGSRIKFKGKEHIVWSINAYLGLSNQSKIHRVDEEAVANWEF